MGEEKHKVRDKWDKIEILGKVAASFTTAIVILAMGIFGNLFVQSLENKRTYTELLTQREQADTNLRKDMFSVLLKGYLSISRDKGNRREREIVQRHRDLGIDAQRVPLSGAAGGRFSGDIDLNPFGAEDTTLTTEVKARAVDGPASQESAA